MDNRRLKFSNLPHRSRTRTEHFPPARTGRCALGVHDAHRPKSTPSWPTKSSLSSSFDHSDFRRPPSRSVRLLDGWQSTCASLFWKGDDLPILHRAIWRHFIGPFACRISSLICLTPFRFSSSLPRKGLHSLLVGVVCSNRKSVLGGGEGRLLAHDLPERTLV